MTALLAVFLALAAFAGGYAASIYSWPRIKLVINGAQAEAKALRAKADALLVVLRKG